MEGDDLRSVLKALALDRCIGVFAEQEVTMAHLKSMSAARLIANLRDIGLDDAAVDTLAAAMGGAMPMTAEKATANEAVPTTVDIVAPTCVCSQASLSLAALESIRSGARPLQALTRD